MIIVFRGKLQLIGTSFIVVLQKMKRSKEPIIIENLAIEAMAAEGKCIARRDGMVIFAKDTAPGDVVDLKINFQKKSFMEGYPIAFHAYSNDRTSPLCEHFGICGGCKWQHVTYDKQLAFKQQQVVDNLERIGKVALPGVNPIIGSAGMYNYRNKLEFTFSDRRWLSSEEIATQEEINRAGLGFHMPGRFDKVLDIKHCHLQGGLSNDIRNWFRTYGLANGLEHYDLHNHRGYLRSLMIRTTSTGQTMVVLQVAKDDETTTHTMLNALKSAFPGITSINYIINTKKNDTIFDQEVINYIGEPHLVEQMGELKFMIGPKSFYQTNSEQAHVMYSIVRRMANLTGSELVYDLYTGTGTIANFCASGTQQIIGIEYVKEAVEDAEKNAKLNKITNAKFYSGDMKDVLTPEFVVQNGQPDVIITDPPRAGMHPDVIKVLRDISAQSIVYVSCNPATQARDLQLLDDLYAVVEVQPLDMFPHTHHVENIVLLQKRP